MFIYRGFLELSTGLILWFDTYPQVYPHINVTDNLIRYSRGGVKWRIVEIGALLTMRS